MKRIYIFLSLITLTPLLSSCSNSTPAPSIHLGVNGEGFLILQDPQTYYNYYTEGKDFFLREGCLQASLGFCLKGFLPDEEGNLTSNVGPLSVAGLGTGTSLEVAEDGTVTALLPDQTERLVGQIVVAIFYGPDGRGGTHLTTDGLQELGGYLIEKFGDPRSYGPSIAAPGLSSPAFYTWGTISADGPLEVE